MNGQAEAGDTHTPDDFYRPVDTGQNFPELEEHILERWKERRIFQKAVKPGKEHLNGSSMRVRPQPTESRVLTMSWPESSRTSTLVFAPCVAITSPAKVDGIVMVFP